MSYAREVVIVAYGRSPLTKAKKGALSGVHPVEYGSQTLKGVLAKVPQLNPVEIGDVIVGCARPIRQTGRNTARIIVQRAELPNSVPAQTINRFCSSGLQAIATGANAIAAGEEDVIVCGGIEDMTDCFIPYPYPIECYNDWIEHNSPGIYMSMGETAERVADKYNISRERMDYMAVQSHSKALKAKSENKFSSIIPIVIEQDGKIVTITEDDGIRPNTSMESLLNLKPCFREDGKVTAATSSQTTDGSSFVVLMSKSKAAELGIEPIARILGYSCVGVDPTVMGIGPMAAVPKVMEKVGLSIADMDVIEINEAFASQYLACTDELGFPVEKVNPYGGAIALGHPLGATGAVLTCKALDYLEDNNKQYALVTMCIGGGMGAAAIFERI